MGSVSLREGTVAYTLPAPAGYWVANTFPCSHVPGLSDELQPCQLLGALPDLEGAIISFLPIGDAEKLGGVDEDYPYRCGAGFFGDASVVSQTRSRCSGLCPAGYSEFRSPLDLLCTRPTHSVPPDLCGGAITVAHIAASTFHGTRPPCPLLPSQGARAGPPSRCRAELVASAQSGVPSRPRVPAGSTQLRAI